MAGTGDGEKGGGGGAHHGPRAHAVDDHVMATWLAAVPCAFVPSCLPLEGVHSKSASPFVLRSQSLLSQFLHTVSPLVCGCRAACDGADASPMGCVKPNTAESGDINHSARICTLSSTVTLPWVVRLRARGGRVEQLFTVLYGQVGEAAHGRESGGGARIRGAVVLSPKQQPGKQYSVVRASLISGGNEI